MENKRDCIYTGLKARTKNKYITENVSSHNWGNNVPCHFKYAEYRKERGGVTNDEKLCFELFWKNEFNEINGLDKEMTKEVFDAQERNLTELKKWSRIKHEKQVEIKQNQIDACYFQKEVLSETEKEIEEFLKRRKSLWD